MKSLKEYIINEKYNFNNLKQDLTNFLVKVNDKIDNAIEVNITNVNINDSFMSHLAGYIIENVIHNTLYILKDELNIENISDKVNQNVPYDFEIDGQKIEIKAKHNIKNEIICTNKQVKDLNNLIFCIISYSIKGNKIIIEPNNLEVIPGNQLYLKENTIKTYTW